MITQGMPEGPYFNKLVEELNKCSSENGSCSGCDVRMDCLQWWDIHCSSFYSHKMNKNKYQTAVTQFRWIKEKLIPRVTFYLPYHPPKKDFSGCDSLTDINKSYYENLVKDLELRKLFYPGKHFPLDSVKIYASVYYSGKNYKYQNTARLRPVLNGLLDADIITSNIILGGIFAVRESEIAPMTKIEILERIDG